MERDGDRDVERGWLEEESGEESRRAPAGEKDEEEEGEEETEAYRYLLDVLEQAEDKSVSGAAKFVMGVEAVVVLGLTAALACTLTLDDMKHSKLRGLRMWQYVMMAITLFAGLSIVRFLTMILFFFLMRCRLGLHRDVGYFLREMKRSIDVTVWFSGVLFLWYVWFRPGLRHVHGELSEVAAHQLTRFLIAACLGGVLWVGKNALFFWLEADLHYRKLADRITRTIRQLHVLQILHKFGVWVFLHHSKAKTSHKDALVKKDENAEAEYIRRLKEEGDNICKELLVVKRDRVPVWILRRLCEEYMNQIVSEPLPIRKDMMQDPDKLMEQALMLFRDMKGIKHDNIWDDDEVKLEDVISRYNVDLKDLKLFFRSISGQKIKLVTKPENSSQRLRKRRSGFSSLMNAVREKFWSQPKIAGTVDTRKSPEIEECDLRIGRDEFVSWAVVAYRNCWGLQSTLKSSEEIIVKLNRVMIVFVLILALIIWLLLSEIVDTAQIALLFSPLIAVKFIFSESTKNMFDGLIFSLAMHPFSPGDRVIINTMELLVTEISILTTTFYNYQTGEELVYPNSELSTTQIINLENNPDQSDQLEFYLDKNTALEDIRDLEIRIQMSLNERVDAFKTKVVKAEMGLENIKMIVHFNYVGSYLTSRLKAFHRSEMLSTIMLLLKTVEPSKQKKDANSNQKEEKDDNMSAQKEKKDVDLSTQNKDGDADPTSKPYVVDITLARTVKKVKHLDMIKSAVTKSLEKDYDKNFKVVFNYVAEKRVKVNFFVWKVGQQQISVEKLDEHCKHIFANLQIQNGATDKPCLQVTQVKVQPTSCIIKITMDGVASLDKMILVKTVIKRCLCENYYPYDFDVVEVNEERSLYEIHASIQFPHNMGEEKHELDMVKIMTNESEHLLKHIDLKKILTTITVEKRGSGNYLQP